MKKYQIEIITVVLMLFCQNITITNNFELTNKNEKFNYNHKINVNKYNKSEWENTILPDGKLKYLSEMPLDKLLKIKKSLEEVMKISSIKEINSTIRSPQINEKKKVDVDVKHYDDDKGIAEDRSIFDKFDKKLDVNMREPFMYGNENGKALPLTNNIQIQRFVYFFLLKRLA
jgi:hypothetical protein